MGCSVHFLPMQREPSRRISERKAGAGSGASRGASPSEGVSHPSTPRPSDSGAGDPEDPPYDPDGDDGPIGGQMDDRLADMISWLAEVPEVVGLLGPSTLPGSPIDPGSMPLDLPIDPGVVGSPMEGTGRPAVASRPDLRTLLYRIIRRETRPRGSGQPAHALPATISLGESTSASSHIPSPDVLQPLGLPDIEDTGLADGAGASPIHFPLPSFVRQARSERLGKPR